MLRIEPRGRLAGGTSAAAVAIGCAASGFAWLGAAARTGAAACTGAAGLDRLCRAERTDLLQHRELGLREGAGNRRDGHSPTLPQHGKDRVNPHSCCRGATDLSWRQSQKGSLRPCPMPAPFPSPRPSPPAPGSTRRNTKSSTRNRSPIRRNSGASRASGSTGSSPIPRSRTRASRAMSRSNGTRTARSTPPPIASTAI